MNRDKLHALIESLVRGDLSAAEHRVLQDILKADDDARELFRERMDLEANLRAWAAAGSNETDVKVTGVRGRPIEQTGKTFSAPRLFAAAVAASILILAGAHWWRVLSATEQQREIADVSPDDSQMSERANSFVGVIREQEDCDWAIRPVTLGGRFATGKLSLAKGVAQLVFDSGTDLVLEAPCELLIASVDTATLLGGNAFVNVTELSNGFTLQTPESLIVDEGTQYAVALDEESTEVHVFDGSVIWIPTVGSAAVEDRIHEGEARRYLRSDLSAAKRIPFGLRQFVRRIEADIQERSGVTLLAYDGFENLAGRVRRGRSGFGWTGGWTSVGRGRGRPVEILDAPDDEVFGHSRDQRRLLSLEYGDDIRRDFEKPIHLESDGALFVSLLVEQASRSAEQSTSLHVSLEPDLPGRGRSRQQVVSFGITDEGFPFINSGGSIAKTASPVLDKEVCLCVMKLPASGHQIKPFVRVFRSNEKVDDFEPFTWTVSGNDASIGFDVNSIRLRCGENAVWRIDELRVGTTWRSVTLLGSEN